MICFGPSPSPPRDPGAEERRTTLLENIPHAKFEGASTHTTDTVDVGYVLEGEIDLELDDGLVVHMKSGDVYVQNGTRHGWHNRSDRDCVMLVALIGAQPPQI